MSGSTTKKSDRTTKTKRTVETRSIQQAKKPAKSKGKSRSWHDKLHAADDLPRTLVIPAPLEVDGLMRRVPPGKLVTIADLRQALAEKHGTTNACPMTTGIFAWIAAHAAEEARAAGEHEITPYWRTLKSGGMLNAKYPGGVRGQQALLEAEGHHVVRKGKEWVVEGYEQHMAKLGG